MEKIAWCKQKERGISIREPSINLAQEYFSSAEESLKVLNALKESGLEIILFLPQTDPSLSFQQIKAFPTEFSSALTKVFWMTIAFVSCFFRCPLKSFYLWHLERKGGASSLDATKAVYVNASILPCRLDWLHFAFASAALSHEHVAKVIGAKMSLSLRGFDIGIVPIKRPGCSRNVWKMVDKVHSLSQDLYELARKDGLSKAISWQKIPPAINPKQFPPKNGVGELHHPLRLITVSRLTWKKGLSYALEAANILKKRMIPFEYYFIGEGPQEAELRFAVLECRLEKEIHFYGKQKPEQVLSLLQTADIYLQPSVQEGFCNAVLEAQAVGLLCIVTHAEGLSENVLHEKTGWVVPKRNSIAIADQIEQILKMSGAQREQIARQARNRAIQEFTLEKQTEAFQKFFNEPIFPLPYESGEKEA